MNEGGVILVVVLPVYGQGRKEVLGRANACEFEALLNGNEKSSRHANQRDKGEQ